jgi:hypothetical protein
MNFNRVLRTFYYSAKNFRVIAELLHTILHDIQLYRFNEKESRQSYDYSASKIVYGTLLPWPFLPTFEEITQELEAPGWGCIDDRSQSREVVRRKNG